MKILKKIGIVLLALILLIVIISFFIPRKVQVQRSMDMKASPATLFTLVNDLHNWEKWSPWHKLDPEMKLSYSESGAGVGAWYAWTSEKGEVGSGKLTILESTEPDHVKTQMAFNGDEENPAFADYIFTATPEGTKVVWAFECDMGMNPFKKILGLMMDKFLGPTFEQGLTSLKEISEAAPVAESKETIGGYEFEERQMDKMLVAGIREKMNFADLNSAKFAEWYGAIDKSMKAEKAQFAGSPMSIYYTYDEKTKSTDMEAAVPVDKMMKGDAKVKCHELPATKALVVKYYGDYSKTEAVYTAAYAYIAEHKLQNNGGPMEIYVTDPGVEKDTTKWLTEIVFPIQ